MAGMPELPKIKISVSFESRDEIEPDKDRLSPRSRSDSQSTRHTPSGLNQTNGRSPINKTCALVMFGGTIIALVVVAVVIAVVLTKSDGTSDDEDSAPLTLLVSFLDAHIDALSLLPPLLVPYVQQTIINSTSLQILQCASSNVLKSVQQTLAEHPELDVLVRDFLVFLPSANVQAQGKNHGNAASQAFEHSTGPGSQRTLVEAMSVPAAPQSTEKEFKQSAVRSLQGDLPTSINDPLYSEQWYLTKTGTEKAWSTTIGSVELVVAIVDTGMDLSHEDLKQQLWVNTREIPNNGIDDDKNGYIDDVHGYDFNGVCSTGAGGTCNQCAGGPTPQDTMGHGTGVAGIIAAQQNNYLGISGTSPGVKLMILKISDCFTGAMYVSAVAKAFDYAARMGADIISCSFGDRYADYFWPVTPAPLFQQDFSKAYIKAMQPATDLKIPVVAASGNEFLNLDQLLAMHYPYSPCMLSVMLPNVMCVSGTAPDDSQPSFANAGKLGVQLAAPAVNLTTTQLGGGYADVSGTSEAAPIVSAAMALVMSVLGRHDGNYVRWGATAQQVVLSTVDLVPGLQVNTSGRLNIGAAVAKAVAMAGTPPAPLQPVLLTAGPPAVLIPGFVETYYANPTRSWSTSGLTLYSQGLWTGPPSFSFPTPPSSAPPLLLSLVSFLLLPSPGTYRLQLTCTPPDTPAQLSLGGRTLEGASTGVRVSINESGWYRVQLLVQSPSPKTRVTLLLQPPGAAAPDLPSAASLVASSADPLLKNGAGVTAQQPELVPAVDADAADHQPWQGLLVSFDVRSSKAAAGVQEPSMAGSFSYSTVLPDLSYDPPAAKSSGRAADTLLAVLLAALPPGSATPEPGSILVGVMQGWVHSQHNMASMSLKVTCQRCSVHLNGLALVSNWQLSPRVYTLQTPCLTLSQSSLFNLTLTFAIDIPIAKQAAKSSEPQPPWSLTWAPCSAATSAQAARRGSAGSQHRITAGSFSSLAKAGLFGGATLWRAVNGSVPGVQCTAWLPVPSNTTGPPALPVNTSTYSFQLPVCATGAAGSSTTRGACALPTFNFRLQDVLSMLRLPLPTRTPPKFTATTPLAVRCVTYWSASPSSGTLLASSSAATAAQQVTLAGTQVSWGPTTPPRPPPVKLPVFSPASGYRRRLQVDWWGVTAATNLTLLDGAAPLPINLSTMALPPYGRAST